MKIALLSYEYPPETGYGGIGSYTWHHARALVKLGHEVHVLAGAPETTPLRTTEHDGVRVFRFWAGGRAMRVFEQPRKLRLWWTRQRLQNAWSMYAGVSALHREHRYDVIEMPECGAEGALVTLRMAVPTVVRLHSPSKLIMPYYDVRRSDIWLCSAIERQAIGHATALTACSRFMAEEAARTMHVTRSVPVITNGLDVEWFDAVAEPVDVYRKYGLPRRRLMILFTGRMERRKGIHLCTEIAASILERFDVTFVFAGDDLFGYLANTLLPFLASRRLVGSVHWLGALALEDVRQLVKAADIFLLPSLWENCPYSCLEAMAAGRAVVGPDQGGIPELIETGVNGLLAVSGHAPSFVQRIEHLIEDATLRAKLGRAARETVLRAHGDTHVARQALVVYEDVIAGRTTAASRPVVPPRLSPGASGLSVSVIIPAYNAAETLADALNSVFAQTSPHWEAIVVDDGSTDRTGEIAREFGERDPRITVVSQVNAGEGAARNTGIAHAHYDWLLFLDADDWIGPTLLERLTNKLIAHPELDAAYADSVRVALDGSERPFSELVEPEGDLFPVLARRMAFPVHACLLSRRVVTAVGGFDRGLKTCADWDLWQRFARTGAKFGAVREVLAYYRLRPQATSHDGLQLLTDGLRVLAQGHSSDFRVATAAPAHVIGEPPELMPSQQYYMLAWCAGLMIGTGHSALPLLPLVGDAHCRLHADAIASILFNAALHSSCRPAASWEAQWPGAGPLVKEFLAVLENQSQTSRLAARALSHLKRLIRRASIDGR